MSLYYFPIICPCKLVWLFIWTNLNVIHSWCFVLSLFEIRPNSYKFIQRLVAISFFISYLKMMWPCVWTKLNTRIPKMLRAKISSNWSSGSGEIDFKFYQCIFAITLSSSFGKWCDPLFTRTWFPIIKRFRL